MNAVDIAGRRRLIFKFRALELTPAEMRVLISEKYSVSIDTIRRDLRLMTDWLPGMLSLQEDEADESLYRLVGLVQMAQRQLAKLSFSADNDNARVGASKALAAIACKEIELRQDLGRIPRMPISIKHIESIDLEGLDEEAIAAIVQNFMDDEARRLRDGEGPLPLHSGESVDRSKNKDGETHPSPLNGLPTSGSPEWEDTSRGGKMAGGYSVKR